MLPCVSAAAVIPGDRPGTFVLWMDGIRQSEVDLDDPTRLGFDYARRLADVVDLAAPPGEPLRVVHIGGAAMMLPRYVGVTRPRSAQVVLEPDAELTEMVRRLLPLPPRSGVKVRPVDGRTGVAALRDASADVVLLDAFAGGETPPELLTEQFFADVARVLGENGVLAVNLADTAPFPVIRRAVAGLRVVFEELFLGAEPATLKAKRRGNVVAVAGAEVPLEGFLQRVSTHATPYRVFDERAVSDSFGGGRPLTDADVGVALPLE